MQRKWRKEGKSWLFRLSSSGNVGGVRARGFYKWKFYLSGETKRFAWRFYKIGRIKKIPIPLHKSFTRRGDLCTIGPWGTSYLDRKKKILTEVSIDFMSPYLKRRRNVCVCVYIYVKFKLYKYNKLHILYSSSIIYDAHINFIYYILHLLYVWCIYILHI